MGFKLFKKREPKAIPYIEEKRKAVESFCAAQQGNCKECQLYYKIPWYDECYYSDEDVDYSYGLIYGDADPREVNKGQEGGANA